MNETIFMKDIQDAVKSIQENIRCIKASSKRETAINYYYDLIWKYFANIHDVAGQMLMELDHNQNMFKGDR